MTILIGRAIHAVDIVESPHPFILRLAQLEDVPALNHLIPLSVRALQAPYYAREQMEAALGTVFAVDRQLIRDQTYYVAEAVGEVVACGGWSRRRSMCGGDGGRVEPDPEIDPARDAPRLRAFFVRPDWARRGIGRAIVVRCEEAMRAVGYHRAELSATLAGEPLYAALGYAVVERGEIEMRDGLKLPVVRMGKRLDHPG